MPLPGVAMIRYMGEWLPKRCWNIYEIIPASVRPDYVHRNPKRIPVGARSLGVIPRQPTKMVWTPIRSFSSLSSPMFWTTGQWADGGARFSQIRLDTSWTVVIP